MFEREFAVLEEAAVAMLDCDDRGAFLLKCRNELERLIMVHIGDLEASARIAAKLANVIAKRCYEIERDAGVNLVRTIQ